MLFRYTVILLTFITLISCNKTDNNSIVLDADKELFSFQFDQNTNEGFLSETISGVVEENTIRVIIPEIIDTKNLVATFEFVGQSVYVGDELQESEVTANDFSKPIVYEVHAEDGSVAAYNIKLTFLPDVKSEVPHLYIQTDDNIPVTSKDDYIGATIQIDGKGVYDDFEGTTEIRGRGNDSWNFPKKPYRIKLDSKAALLGMLPEKSWILRSNYRAESLMLDAVGFRMAALLDMPYTHNAVPVDVTVNGEFMGSYMFTEQKQVKSNRINVVDDGLYLVLDTYMNKPPGIFYSDSFELPVMSRYPKLENYPVTEVAGELAKIKAEFHAMEAPIADDSFPDNDYLDYLDIEELVNYMIVYNLSLNREINHPKSTYMHKHKEGKFKMGPVWDFDWGFGYNPNSNTHFNNPQQALLEGGNSMKGDVFFSRLMQDPAVQSLYKQRWQMFKAEKYPELISYILDYSETISGSYDLDYALWGEGVGSAEEAAQQLIQWLDQRVQYIDSNVANF